MNSSKTVSRNLAIVLAIIIAILLASLIGTIVYYSNLNRSLSSNAGASSQEISTLQSQIAELNQKINTLTNIVNLQEQTTLVNQQTISQPAGSYDYWNF